MLMKNFGPRFDRVLSVNFGSTGSKPPRANSNLSFLVAAAMMLAILGLPGNVAASSTLNPSRRSLEFGIVTVGSKSQETVTLTNSGTSSVTISRISVSGAGFSESSFRTPLTLAAGRSVTLTAHCAPAVAGTMAGSIAITSNASNRLVQIPLDALGVRQLSASKGTVSFGDIKVGSAATQSVSLTNYGKTSVSISRVAVAGRGFSQTGLVAPLTIAAGKSFTFTTRFAPMAIGAETGSIVVTSTAFNTTMNMVLTGAGTGAAGTLSVTPGLVTFGNVPTGLSNTQPMRLSNTGSGTVTISRTTLAGSGFKISGLSVPLEIAPHGSASFSIAFDPSVAGSVAGSLSLFSNATNPTLGIRLTGTGIGASALLAASPSSLSFGTVTVNTDKTLDVTLRNTGNSDVRLSSVVVSGAGFREGGAAAGITLGPEQSATVAVSFDPKTAASVSGAVTISSNATNSPVRIALSGTGGSQAAHSVALSWAPSSSSGVVGYHVYRGTVSGGPYSIVTSSAVSATNYTDSSVLAGHLYYYVVRAVESNGVESKNSSQVSADIP
jgi:hypothetical protein